MDHFFHRTLCGEKREDSPQVLMNKDIFSQKPVKILNETIK
jgi:hypothetical protein